MKKIHLFPRMISVCHVQPGPPDGRFRFAPDWAAVGPDAAGMPALPDHWDVIDRATPERPFRLVTAPARQFLNSTFTETGSARRMEKDEPTARLHPDDLARLGLPAGCEFLDAVTGQYYADTVSWGAIGARTTESQVHRELASGLSCPVGFKNGTGGDVGIAVDAIVAAGHAHAFLSPTDAGRTALYRTRGNADAHLILRGGSAPNFDPDSVRDAADRLQRAGVDRRLMIDCSHANSGKDHRRQSAVALAVAARWSQESTLIGGLMLESHLVAGRQDATSTSALTYGQSLTDACIGWEETERTLRARSRIADRWCRSPLGESPRTRRRWR